MGCRPADGSSPATRHANGGGPGKYAGARRAFTTDPKQHSLGWSVRYRPGHGRTVLLMRDGDTSHLRSQWTGDELLFRAGGYWWNGETWHRPGQVWDPIAQDYERRRARMTVTITASDMLDGRVDPARAYVGKVLTFDPDETGPDNRLDHLALWAERRQEQENALELERCVVDLSGPELTGAQLIGAPEMAELGGISASTLRAYISRGNSEVPRPQVVVGDRDSLSPGAAEVRDRFAADFQHTLFDRPDVRKRWVLRQRNKESVAEIAGELPWSVAASLRPHHPHRGPWRRRAARGHGRPRRLRRGGQGEGVVEPAENDVAGGQDARLVHPVLPRRGVRHHRGDPAPSQRRVPATDTLRVLRRDLTLDGKLTDEQRETYFALLEPHKATD
ncbi:hypothetical protein ACFXOY_28145 [Streptomyces niveus]|uniref:hypothetical protein n=1 Tax=Streptomyces niveus TaxID=193462 RepID=UPI0036AC448E